MRGGGGKGEGRLLSWFERGYVILRENFVSGVWPQPLITVIMLLRRVFVVFIS